MQLVRQVVRSLPPCLPPFLVPDHVRLESAMGEAGQESSRHSSQAQSWTRVPSEQGHDQQKPPGIKPQQDQPRRSISQELDEKTRVT